MVGLTAKIEKSVGITQVNAISDAFFMIYSVMR